MKDSVQRLFEMMKEAEELLRSQGFARPQIEARALMGLALGLDAAALIAADDRELKVAESEMFRALLKRRLAFEPLAYLRGEKEFYGRAFKVSPDCLIPRPETEELVEGILKWIQDRGLQSGRILDIGTGSGCIAITLQKELGSSFEVYGLDTSERALELARSNAALLESHVRFIHWDLQSEEVFPVEGDWNVIASNPPYIPSGEISHIQADVRDYEPRIALDGGEDGLDFIRSIMELFWSALTCPGLLALETHSLSQRQQILQEFASLKMKDWTIGPHLFMERISNR